MEEHLLNDGVIELLLRFLTGLVQCDVYEPLDLWQDVNLLNDLQKLSVLYLRLQIAEL